MSDSKASSLKDLAAKYGVHKNTLSNWIYDNPDLVDELVDKNWSSGKVLFPIHKEIIYKYLGKPSH